MDTVKSSDVVLHGKDSKTKDVALHPPGGHEQRHRPYHRVGQSIGGRLRHQISSVRCLFRQRCVHQGSFPCSQPPRHGRSHPPAQTGPLGCVVPPNAYGNLIETHREKPTWGQGNGRRKLAMGGNERRQCKWNSSEWNPASFRWVSAPSGCYAAIYCMKRCNKKLVGMRVEISRQNRAPWSIQMCTFGMGASHKSYRGICSWTCDASSHRETQLISMVRFHLSLNFKNLLVFCINERRWCGWGNTY